MPTQIDSVGSELRAWLSDMPSGVDPQVEAARQRIGRIGRHFDRLLVDVASDHGLTVGDWAALAAVRRASSASGCTPKELAHALGVTSGTMTVRIERLIRSGYVQTVSAKDQRSRPVRLTPIGLDAWERATKDRTRREADLLTALLGDRQLVQLNNLLAVVLAGLEADAGPVSRHDIPRAN